MERSGFITDDAVAIFGDQASCGHELETKLVSESVAEAIGKYSDGTVVEVVSLEIVRRLCREALRPDITDENLVGRVKIVAIARIQSSGRVEAWFSQVIDQQSRTEREPRRGFVGNAERAFQVDVVFLTVHLLIIISATGAAVQDQLQPRIPKGVIENNIAARKRRSLLVVLRSAHIVVVTAGNACVDLDGCARKNADTRGASFQGGCARG